MIYQMKDGIVRIEGVGVVTPSGLGAKYVEAFLLDEYKASKQINHIQEWLTSNLIQKKLQKWARPSKLAYLAVQEAVQGFDNINSERTALVIGTDYTHLEAIVTLYEDASRYGVNGTNPVLFPETVLNVIGGHLSADFGIKGVNVTISNGNQSGVGALKYAVDLLRTGKADTVIVCVVNLLPSAPFEEVIQDVGYLAESVAAVRLSLSDSDNGQYVEACLNHQENICIGQTHKVYKVPITNIPLALIAAYQHVQEQEYQGVVILPEEESDVEGLLVKKRGGIPD